MNYRGKVLMVSPLGGSDRPTEYVCTAHHCDQIEVVPTCPGTEGLVFPLIPLSGPGLIGVVYDSREDADLIRRVKNRCASVIHGMEIGGDLFSSLFPPSAVNGVKEGVQLNLARLESLDGDEPALMSPPAPSMDSRSALDRVFDELFGGRMRISAEIHDSVLVVPKQQDTIGKHPNYVGKLVFIEIPLARDEHGESGEHVVIEQSEDSLYAVKTNSCLSGLSVLRIPFEDGDEKITILNSYEDDDFVRDFIERLDDMDTEDYEAIECDRAETVSRRLARMLEKKDAERTKRPNPFDDLVNPAPRPLNILGCLTGRMSSRVDDEDLDCQPEDRVSHTGCGCGL